MFNKPIISTDSGGKTTSPSFAIAGTLSSKSEGGPAFGSLITSIPGNETPLEGSILGSREPTSVVPSWYFLILPPCFIPPLYSSPPNCPIPAASAAASASAAAASALATATSAAA